MPTTKKFVKMGEITLVIPLRTATRVQRAVMQVTPEAKISLWGCKCDSDWKS